MYVSMAKRKILECLELPAETLSLLTSNDKETNLHAVPLWSVTLKSMARLLKHYRGRYTTVVGFQPTGWTQKQGVCLYCREHLNLIRLLVLEVTECVHREDCAAKAVLNRVYGFTCAKITCHTA